MGEKIDKMAVDTGDFANVSNIDDLRRLDFRTASFNEHLPGANQCCILACQSDSFPPVLIDQVNDALVNGTPQHHLNDIHGTAVGHSHAVNKL